LQREGGDNTYFGMEHFWL